METKSIIPVWLSLAIWFSVFGIWNVFATDGFSQIFEKNSTCTDIQNKFATASQMFAYCSVVNARPITFCETCVHEYMDVLERHGEIMQELENGVNCRSQLINIDRLEIIETLFSNFESLWNKGECGNCFEMNPNGTISSTLNNDTKNFQNLNFIVKKCIIDNLPKDKPNICDICRDSYEKLNDFYNVLKYSEGPGRVCMDIVDSMNASRMQWSRDLGCKHDPRTDWPLIVSASFVSLIPIIFYIVLRVCPGRNNYRPMERKQHEESEEVLPSTSGIS